MKHSPVWVGRGRRCHWWGQGTAQGHLYLLPVPSPTQTSVYWEVYQGMRTLPLPNPAETTCSKESSLLLSFIPFSFLSIKFALVV